MKSQERIRHLCMGTALAAHRIMSTGAQEANIKALTLASSALLWALDLENKTLTPDAVIPLGLTPQDIDDACNQFMALLNDCERLGRRSDEAINSGFCSKDEMLAGLAKARADAKAKEEAYKEPRPVPNDQRGPGECCPACGELDCECDDPVVGYGK